MNSCWPGGLPAIGQTAELSRAVAPDDIERFTQISTRIARRSSG